MPRGVEGLDHTAALEDGRSRGGVTLVRLVELLDPSLERGLGEGGRGEVDHHKRLIVTIMLMVLLGVGEALTGRDALWHGHMDVAVCRGRPHAYLLAGGGVGGHGHVKAQLPLGLFRPP